VKLARKLGVELRQSYTRVGKFELIRHQRYAHARQFKRANKALRKLKTYPISGGLPLPRSARSIQTLL
jgi:IS5 family transposase